VAASYNSTVRVFGGSIKVTNGGASINAGAYAVNSAVIELHGVAVETSNGVNPNADLWDAGSSTIRVSGGRGSHTGGAYRTTGTITYTSLNSLVTLNASGFAHTQDVSALAAARTVTWPDVAGVVPVSNARMIYAIDDFMGVGTTSAQIGALGWGGAAASVAHRGHEAGHPGIFRIASTGSLAALWLNYLSGTGMSAWSGLTIEAVFRIDSITNITASFGLGYVNSAVTTNGARVLIFDPSVHANWRLLHITQAGATTYVDTGKAAVANDWVRVKLAFSGGTTTCTIATTSSTTDATVSNSGADTHTTTAHTAQFLVTSSSGTKNLDADLFLLQGTASRL